VHPAPDGEADAPQDVEQHVGGVGVPLQGQQEAAVGHGQAQEGQREPGGAPGALALPQQELGEHDRAEHEVDERVEDRQEQGQTAAVEGAGERRQHGERREAGRRTADHCRLQPDGERRQPAAGDVEEQERGHAEVRQQVEGFAGRGEGDHLDGLARAHGRRTSGPQPDSRGEEEQRVPATRLDGGRAPAPPPPPGARWGPWGWPSPTAASC
jgi:hypothetical protein